MNEHIKNVVIEGNTQEVGTTLTWEFAKDSSRCKSKISYVNKSPEKKKWKYKIVPLEGPFQMQEIHFVFINVNDDSTFFSVYHEFKEQVTPEVMENVSKKNRFLINMIKDTVERSNNK